MKKQIKHEELKWLTRNYMDNMGVCFRYQDRILRIVYRHMEKFVLGLLADKYIINLMKSNLLVETWVIDDIEVEGYEGCLIIEHKKMPFITYFYEWTENMFVDAMRMVIDLDLNLIEHGYELCDPHPGNVGFAGCKPFYLDFGSITKSDLNGLEGIYIIRENWINPLKLIRKKRANSTYSRKILELGSISEAQYKVIYDGSWIGNHCGIFWDYYYRFVNRAFYVGGGSNSSQADIIIKFARRFYHPTKPEIQESKLRKLYKYQRLYKSNGDTYIPKDEWSDYQKGFFDEQGRIHLDDRFKYYIDRIREIKKSSQVEKTLELAGNGGVLSQAIIAENLAEYACVTDVDYGALDAGYEQAKRDKKLAQRITYSSLNVMDYTERGLEQNSYRFKNDIVFMLAVTHHLLLVQKVRLDVLFNFVRKYVTNYLIIEFMPLGLWDGIHENSEELPEWYTIDNFLLEMEKHFLVQTVEQISRNRIAIIARIEQKD